MRNCLSLIWKPIRTVRRNKNRSQKKKKRAVKEITNAQIQNDCSSEFLPYCDRRQVKELLVSHSLLVYQPLVSVLQQTIPTFQSQRPAKIQIILYTRTDFIQEQKIPSIPEHQIDNAHYDSHQQHIVSHQLLLLHAAVQKDKWNDQHLANQ